MAINNGNTDFGLLASFDGNKSIKVSWNKASGIGFNGSITVTRPGDYNTVFSKSYVDSATKSDSFTVPVPYHGEYKIHIKSNQSQTYDIAYCKTFMTRSESVTREFTPQDISNWKAGQIIMLATFVGLGYVSVLRIGLQATMIAFGVSASSVIRHDTDYAGFPTPVAGDKIQSKIEPVSGGIRKTETFIAKNGGYYPPKVNTVKYLTFPR